MSYTVSWLHWVGIRLGIWLCLGVFSYGYCTTDNFRPLLSAHAHNDYEHKRPLFDALEHGFCSFEADIHLVEGKLMVAHDRSQTKVSRTLQSLYLDPLREQIQKNGGRGYAGGPECTLLIDLKSDWRSVYPVLRKALDQYGDILTTFSEGRKNTNAVMAIITGNRTKEMFDGESVRYAAYDGQLTDLDSGASALLIPWISANWSTAFHWGASESFPESEKAKLKEIVRKAHAKSRRVRFWGGPDNPNFWRELLANGVDLINTDDLAGLQNFFQHAGLNIAE